MRVTFLSGSHVVVQIMEKWETFDDMCSYMYPGVWFRERRREHGFRLSKLHWTLNGRSSPAVDVPSIYK
jgi:hypothetical protein